MFVVKDSVRSAKRIVTPFLFGLLVALGGLVLSLMLVPLLAMLEFIIGGGDVGTGVFFGFLLDRPYIDIVWAALSMVGYIVGVRIGFRKISRSKIEVLEGVSKKSLSVPQISLSAAIVFGVFLFILLAGLVIHSASKPAMYSFQQPMEASPFAACDFDQDGQCGQYGLDLLNQTFRSCKGDTMYNVLTDFDGDGCVVTNDLSYFFQNFFPNDILPLYTQLTWETLDQAEQPYFEYDENDQVITKRLSGYQVTSEDVATYPSDFQSYYDQKLTNLGWKQDPGVAADGSSGSRWGYIKNDNHLIFTYETQFSKISHDKPPECPCQYGFSIFSDTISP